MIIDHPGKNHIEQLKKLWQSAFGDDQAFIDSFFRTAFAYDRCRCVLREDRVAGAVYWFDCSWQGGKLAYVYALAVDGPHRGKGLGRLLMGDVRACLLAGGYEGVLLKPGEDWLWDYYGSMGFEPFGSVCEKALSAAGRPEKLQKLGALAFDRARRAYLPAGGVRQEGQMTAFLEELGAFFEGEDFLAAVSGREKRVLEFLGNEEKLPGLLAALELDTAVVRLPGGARPAAMYLPLKGGARKPEYFGLPAD